MEIKCPICGEAVELPETMIGVKVRCPLCEGVFMAEDEEIFLLQPARSYAIVAAGSAENGVVECSDPNGLIKWRYPEINGEIWIDGVSFNIPSRFLVIPSEIDGKPVTTIGGRAFYDRQDIIGVFIPSSVTSIEEGAFLACHSIQSVTISEGVKYIAKHAFASCFSLESVTIPASVTNIASESFEECNNLKSVTILGESVEIENAAFWGCPNLQSVTLLGENKQFDHRRSSAFGGCRSLKGIIRNIGGKMEWQPLR